MAVLESYHLVIRFRDAVNKDADAYGVVDIAQMQYKKALVGKQAALLIRPSPRSFHC